MPLLRLRRLPRVSGAHARNACANACATGAHARAHALHPLHNYAGLCVRGPGRHNQHVRFGPGLRAAYQSHRLRRGGLSALPLLPGHQLLITVRSSYAPIAWPGAIAAAFLTIG